MSRPDSIALAAKAAGQGLEFMLVGGNAVNLYAYRRTTFDIDLLVRESDAQRWRCFFENEGYAVFHATANFIRMRFAADPAAALPVDLMLADEETFRRIFERNTNSQRPPPHCDEAACFAESSPVGRWSGSPGRDTFDQNGEGGYRWP